MRLLAHAQLCRKILHIQLNNLTRCLSDLQNRKLCNTFLNAFTTKTRLGQVLIHDMELLKRMFPTA